MRTPLVFVALLGIALPGVTAAQQRRPDAKTVRSQPAQKAHKEGEYGGVVPGKSTHKAGKRKNTLSWIGFQPKEGGAAQVFIQLSNEVPYEQTVVEGILVVKLTGARYRSRNARRRLDLRFFESALRLITSKRVSKRRARKNRPARTAGIEIRIQFKNPSDARVPTATMRSEKDGFTYLLLDFDPPAGSGSISISDPE